MTSTSRKRRANTPETAEARSEPETAAKPDAKTVRVRLKAGRTGFGRRGDIVEYDKATAATQQSRGNCTILVEGEDPAED